MDGNDDHLAVPSTSKKSPRKSSPKRSPLFPRKRGLLKRGETEGSNQSDISNETATAGCLSQPSSPSLSGRLGRVSRMISRSDANLVHSLKGKRIRHESGDSTGSGHQHTPSNTPEEGSPSRGTSFIAKATGYVTHLKSRLEKHRERVREERESSIRESSIRERMPPQSFASCCGHRHPQDESSDTLAPAPGGSAVPSKGDSYRGSVVEGSASISVNVSYTSSNSSTGFDKEDSLIFATYNSTSNYSPQGDPQQKQQKKYSISSGGASGCVDNTTAQGAGGPGASESNMFSQFPFHTMNVHLQRGRNLVAKDTCGSSDPYVKVKIGDKLLYKSKTINRDLNPIWDESFVLPISDLSQHVIFKVFDYDWGFQDDFMGMASLDPSRLPPNKSTELTLTLTETNTPGTEPMGDIIIAVTLVPRSIEEKEIHLTMPALIDSPQHFQQFQLLQRSIDDSDAPGCSRKWFSGDGQSGRLADTQKRLKSQIWSSVLTVLLLEAKDLSPGEDRVYMDAFVKFRLGNQKYKARTVPRTTNPKWIEQFDFYLYEGQPQIMEVQVFDESFSRDYIGRVAIDVGLLEKEKTHHKAFQLQEGNGEISFLMTVSGTVGIESISDLTSYNPSTEEANSLHSRYSLLKSHHCIKDVGYLTVKVYEAQGLAALDIGGKSDPFCVLELVNARLQTQTEYRTLSPVWNKIFTFAVKDITSVLEVTVFDEDRHHKQEFLGKLNLPLWKIKNGEKKWHMLKERKLVRAAPGSNPRILLELDLRWNPIRAGVRVMDPPEAKFLIPDQRLKRETFLLNIDRLKRIGIAVYDVIQYIESCVEWEYPLRSLIALCTYQVVVYTFQPYMIPLFFMLLMLRQWFVCSITGKPLDEEELLDDEVVMDDEDDDKEDDDKKMTLRQKLQAVQDATQTVQNTLGEIASIIESARNTFRMVVPFISWLAVLALFVATFVLYFIPLRYLAMAWGFHRFFRPILRPNVVPTNEVYNLLLRVPDNLQLSQYRPLRPASSPKATERNRSPPGGSGSGKATQPKKKYKFW